MGECSVFGVCLPLGGAFPRRRFWSGVQKDPENWAGLFHKSVYVGCDLYTEPPPCSVSWH